LKIDLFLSEATLCATIKTGAELIFAILVNQTLAAKEDLN
jgi:hypothetical protein